MKNLNKLHEDHLESARLAGLHYDLELKKYYTRIKKGKKWEYKSSVDNSVLKDENEISRINKLALPPAWKDVRISVNHKNHLQAVGTDARGRIQYKYHAKWREIRDLINFYRLIPFGESLPELRQKVEEDLDIKGLNKDKILATLVWLLDHINMRIGNEEYAKENDTFGLTTLRDKHVTLRKDEVLFSFTGKSHVKHEVLIKNKDIAKIIKNSKELTGNELFQYKDDDGNIHDVKSEDVNLYISENMKDGFTAKDFRTWSASVKMFELLETCTEDVETKTGMTKYLKSCYEKVAEKLGNTPAVSKKSYVHPDIVKSFQEKDFFDKIKKLENVFEEVNYLTKDEIELLLFLKDREKTAFKVLG